MTIETLDYIVRTIEALFYVLTGTVALLTYLGARKISFNQLRRRFSGTKLKYSHPS